MLPRWYVPQYRPDRQTERERERESKREKETGPIILFTVAAPDVRILVRHVELLEGVGLLLLSVCSQCAQAQPREAGTCVASCVASSDAGQTQERIYRIYERGKLAVLLVLAAWCLELGGRDFAEELEVDALMGRG